MEVHRVPKGKTQGEVNLDFGEDSEEGREVGVADHGGEDRVMAGDPWMGEIRGEVENHEEDHIREVGGHCVGPRGVVEGPRGGHEVEDHRGDHEAEEDPPGDEVEDHHGKRLDHHGRGVEDCHDNQGAPLGKEGTPAREEEAYGEEA